MHQPSDRAAPGWTGFLSWKNEKKSNRRSPARLACVPVRFAAWVLRRQKLEPRSGLELGDAAWRGPMNPQNLESSHGVEGPPVPGAGARKCGKSDPKWCRKCTKKGPEIEKLYAQK